MKMCITSYTCFFKLLDKFNDVFFIGVKSNCHNPNFGRTIKVKGLQGCRPRENPRVTSHTPRSVGKCEGMNPHTTKATLTLGDGVLVDS
jgi:hypothetical protein